MRWMRAIFDLGYTMRGIRGWFWFHRDLRKFRRMGGVAFRRDHNPQVHDKVEKSPYDAHYFHMDNWALRRVIETKPAWHVDVGSRVDTVAHIAAVVPTTFVDIRPLEAKAPGLTSRAGNIMEMPYKDGEVPSLSCLHVAEHIGLGRYGDPIDPEGTVKACKELARILAPEGNLFFAMPVGRERVCFNGHRVHDPTKVPEMFPGLEVVEFAAVDDAGNFARHRKAEELVGSDYACGIYWLRKPVR